MDIVYAREDLPTSMNRSIFLAGPTPRSDTPVPSWRGEMIERLRFLGFDGHIFIPEDRNGEWSKDNYDDQLEWEEAALKQADCIIFWVPRDIKNKMPAFTTNDEWGAWKHSGKVVFGAPKGADKVSYQQHYAKKLEVPLCDTLISTARAAMDMVGKGAYRTGGEVKVPLYIWKQESFQRWYMSQVEAGNELVDANLLWQFTAPKAKTMFCWVLQVAVYVAAEDRVKANEFVIGRPDISSVVLWHRAPTLHDTKVVLVREFRVTTRTEDGFLREFPGGSSTPFTDPEITALKELKEEAGGFTLDPNRLIKHDSRQLFGTLSSVHAHVFSAEITDKELEFFESQRGKAHGVKKDTERTFIEVTTVGELLEKPLSDWSSLGMVFAGLAQAMR